MIDMYGLLGCVSSIKLPETDNMLLELVVMSGLFVDSSELPEQSDRT
jgi:hypothetical protein